MNITEHQQDLTVQYCFPDNNSCRKEVRTGPGNIFLFILLSFISVCTVLFNLLVITSISHFKQLHTPTNLLILSLAVADLLVGLIVMPVNIIQLRDSCWYLGKMACAVIPLINIVSTSASLCSMTCIAVDRYIAVNDPLLYSTKITVCKTSLIIILGWSVCLFYVITVLYFNDHLLQSQLSMSCYGECVIVMKYSWVIVDLVISFLCPCSIIIILYAVIFIVARRQAIAVKSMTNVHSQGRAVKVSITSETKAAKTLGIVVCFYLGCWIPFFLSSLFSESFSSVTLFWIVFSWLLYISSAVNPIIYAIFYPWFRVSAKCILTCRIFDPSSSSFNLFREHF
ncbi:trace amine-associated receptor 13c-like [Brachyhypopomus gauderio]|uniref:trace amine-associated receptor 13c-like n=1 Tax=Brachyhypopomus gauderio TaxID=698409 RepID=UPI004041BEF7